MTTRDVWWADPRGRAASVAQVKVLPGWVLMDSRWPLVAEPRSSLRNRKRLSQVRTNSVWAHVALLLKWVSVAHPSKVTRLFVACLVQVAFGSSSGRLQRWNMRVFFLIGSALSLTFALLVYPTIIIGPFSTYHPPNHPWEVDPSFGFLLLVSPF